MKIKRKLIGGHTSNAMEEHKVTRRSGHINVHRASSGSAMNGLSRIDEEEEIENDEFINKRKVIDNELIILLSISTSFCYS